MVETGMDGEICVGVTCDLMAVDSVHMSTGKPDGNEKLNITTTGLVGQRCKPSCPSNSFCQFLLAREEVKQSVGDSRRQMRHGLREVGQTSEMERTR